MDPLCSRSVVETVVQRPRAYRLGKALASPTGVLVIVPTLVVAVGVGVLLLGLAITRETSDRLVKNQLATQAAEIERDVGAALDQAAPLLDRLRALADPALPLADAAPRLHDLHAARAGVAHVGIAFRDGTMRSTVVEDGELRVRESGDSAYIAFAGERGERAWMAPREVGTAVRIACVEPVRANGELVAAVFVEFDLAALSQFLAPRRGPRSVVFTRDGAILAGEKDAAIAALLARLATLQIDGQRFVTVEGHLAAVAPLAGARAGVTTPLDWYVVTLVPQSTMLGPARRLQRQSLFAAAGALALALGVAVVFAWNLIRMRKAVGAADARARSAEERATELGSYRLVEKLGAGGMGEVWRAEHRLLARQAAIKLVRAESLKDPVRAVKVRERFRREAQTLAAMRSRHTIALYDYGVADDGTFFYVMELLEGLDLDAYVRQYGAMPAARVIHLLAQACQSLAEAHDAGLLHRDIKPANLFLTRAADEVDIIKLLDFGIVRSFAERAADPIDAVALPTVEERMARMHRLTKTGAVVGTTGYIAPEQAEGRDIDGRSDLYAVGCVAWWLLTASEVFPRSTDEHENLRAHREEAVPDLAMRTRAWIPDELAVLVRELLAKRPDDRPPHARAVATRLRAIAIPDEHAWTEARAHAWWQRHAAKTTSADKPVAEKRLLVSDRTERRSVE